MQAVQAAAAAIGAKAVPSTSSTTSTSTTTTSTSTDDKENKPSVEILQQVFSAFGEIRCCDIPSLDPLRPPPAHLSTNVPIPPDTVFDAFVQFNEYIGFVKAMDACRNMKLMLIDESNVAYTANIKVEETRNTVQREEIFNVLGGF